MKMTLNRLIMVGVVYHVQERLIQIKIIKEFIGEALISIVSSQLNNIVIRQVIPFSILSEA